MLSRRRWLSAVAVALVVSGAPSSGAAPSLTERLITAIDRKLDHLQAEIETSPLTGVARRRLEARLFDARTDIAALGESHDPTESARIRALRARLDRLVRLLQDRPV